MDPVLPIVLIALAIVVVAVVLMCNGLVRRRNAVDESWAQIDVQLRCPHGLIPNLVNAVKGYMGLEQRVWSTRRRRAPTRWRLRARARPGRPRRRTP